MKKVLLFAIASALLMSVAFVSAEEKAKDSSKKKVNPFSKNKDDDAAASKKPKLTCPVSGQPAKKDKSVAYKDAKVYFCCDKCPVAFAKDTKKFATKANHQLAFTKQFTQAKCPIKGTRTNRKQTVTIAGTRIAFCCGGCKGKVAKAKGDEQLELVFADSTFAKAYVKRIVVKGKGNFSKNKKK